METDITSRMNAEGLAALLTVAADSPPQDQPPHTHNTVQDALDSLLAGKLPLTSDAAAELSAVLGRTTENLLAAADRTLRDLLLDPQTDLAVLRFLKEYARERSSWSESDAERAAGVVIYCAAIANALIFHSRKITSYSHADLAAELAKLPDKACVPHELKERFRRAITICESKS